ncbi:unnamed protein product [Parnassius apollo]|uniref:(apollo) hypothetical protein n=1 Tax=Parnassius apollo TaxID=110799 RepID=A0A8S3W0G7_PARAO|nr:unnamed protein product [Parnassius apollo]
MQENDAKKEYLRDIDRNLKKNYQKMVKYSLESHFRVSVFASFYESDLMPLINLLDLYTFTHAFKMLCDTDDLVSGLAREGLKKILSERLRKEPSNIDMARYLSVDLDLTR